MTGALAAEGRAWHRGLLGADALEDAARLFGGTVGPGARLPVSALPVSVWAALSGSFPGYRPVRLVAFDKAGSANWGLPWHQDRVIAVRDRAEVPGFGPWSRKGNVWHCEPPAEVLSEMVFLRLHLDTVGPRDGPMQIAVGSHLAGLVDAGRAAAVAEACATEDEIAAPGDVLALSMLTLHRSTPSETGARRRVIRLDLAPGPLPPPLDWAG